MPDVNIFKIDFQNLAKLMDKGRIDKVYNKMYDVADKLTRKETRIFILELQTKIDTIEEPAELIARISDFRKERLNHHMNEMKKLLEKSLEQSAKQKEL